MEPQIVGHPSLLLLPMSKLYVFEIASAFIAVLLLVVDGRHMMADPPNPPLLASMQRAPEANEQLNALSMLVFAGAAHSRVIVQ
jgi:hypothetical protein